jgi:hypothetical protein
VAGGKDPDEILREQGPAALKTQLGQTTPFVEALFTRERDREPLDTPERRAGLKQRLRAAARSIASPGGWIPSPPPWPTTPCKTLPFSMIIWRISRPGASAIRPSMNSPRKSFA